MFRAIGCCMACFILTPSAGLASAKEKVSVKITEITFRSGDEDIQGFLAEPEGKGPFPGIVVIQEWWGLSDWIKDNAKRLAAQGYVALAPDLYRGKLASDPKIASQLVKGLPRDRALRDLKGAVDDLVKRTNVRPDRLGSIGWCMGGGFSLQIALQDSRIRACAMCYGAVVTDPEKLKGLNAPVLGIFGEEDKGIPPSAVHEFQEAMKSAGDKVVAIHFYKAGHGFMRPPNGAGNSAPANPAYQAEAAKDAWKQIEAFFSTYLTAK